MRQRAKTRPCQLVALCALLLSSGCAGDDTIEAPVVDVGSPDIEVLVDDAIVTSAQTEPVMFDLGRRYSPAPTLTLTIRNVGEQPLALTNLSLPLGITVDAAPPTTLAAGASFNAELSMAADVANVVDGALQIDSDDPETPTFVVPLAGEVTPYIRIALEPNPVVDALLEQEMVAQALVGLAVAIVRGQDIVYLRGFGHQDVDQQIPVDPEQTLFRWASLSKSVTGVASLLASERGMIDLDADISSYLTDYQVPDSYLPDGCADTMCALPLSTAERHISMRMLLSHSAGVQHYSNGTVDPRPQPNLTADPNTNTGIAWALPYFASAPLVAVPNTTFSYTTMGFNLAGATLEQAVAMSFADWVDSSVATVLEMNSFQPDYQWVDLPNRAVGYQQIGMTVVPDTNTDVSWKLPGGGYISTVADLGRYCGGLLGEVVVPREARDFELWRPEAPSTNYSFGFYVSSTGVVSHSGSQEKTKTALRMKPADNICFVVMSNATWADPSALSRALMDTFAG